MEEEVGQVIGALQDGVIGGWCGDGGQRATDNREETHDFATWPLAKSEGSSENKTPVRHLDYSYQSNDGTLEYDVHLELDVGKTLVGCKGYAQQAESCGSVLSAYDLSDRQQTLIMPILALFVIYIECFMGIFLIYIFHSCSLSYDFPLFTPNIASLIWGCERLLHH